jgi:hypothetical protein
MSNLNYIDKLPTDILLECAKYICLPPKKLIKEIEHYGNVKKSLDLIKSYSLNNLIIIHYELLKSWYQINAKLFVNEFEAEHESICDFVFSYSKNDFNNVLISFIKKLVMELPANISNSTIQKKIYMYNK